MKIKKSINKNLYFLEVNCKDWLMIDTSDKETIILSISLSKENMNIFKIFEILLEELERIDK